MASATQGQTDQFVALDGTIKLCAFDDATTELNEIILTSDVLQLVRIPGHYWHGFNVLGDRRARLVYFVNRLYDYETPDEERRPWDDSTVLGTYQWSAQDERSGKASDWMQTGLE